MWLAVLLYFDVGGLCVAPDAAGLGVGKQCDVLVGSGAGLHAIKSGLANEVVGCEPAQFAGLCLAVAVADEQRKA